MIIGCRKYFAVRLERQALSCVYNLLYKVHYFNKCMTNKTTTVVDIKRR